MRKLLILSIACLITLCAMAQTEEINAVKFVQGQTTDWYLLSTNPEVTFTDHNPVISGKTYDLANGNIETEFGTAPADLWQTVRENTIVGNWNTICMERTITDVDGATFWNVVSETSTEFILEQEFTPFAAGVGYIIRYTATELKVKYEGDAVTNPVTATQDHPIQGNFAEITCDQDGQNELVDNYVVYNNQLCKVTGWVTMADHRAYVKAKTAPKQAPALHGAPRMTMPKPKETPTELESVNNDENSKFIIQNSKFIINGQFVIIREGKMYNVQGQIIQ